jgi:hypothetical protein
VSPGGKGTPLVRVLSDTPIGRLADFAVNENTIKGAAFLHALGQPPQWILSLKVQQKQPDLLLAIFPVALRVQTSLPFPTLVSSPMRVARRRISLIHRSSSGSSRRLALRNASAWSLIVFASSILALCGRLGASNHKGEALGFGMNESSRKRLQARRFPPLMAREKHAFLVKVKREGGPVLPGGASLPYRSIEVLEEKFSEFCEVSGVTDIGRRWRLQLWTSSKGHRPRSTVVI